MNVDEILYRWSIMKVNRI